MPMKAAKDRPAEEGSRTYRVAEASTQSSRPTPTCRGTYPGAGSRSSTERTRSGRRTVRVRTRYAATSARKAMPTARIESTGRCKASGTATGSTANTTPPRARKPSQRDRESKARSWLISTTDRPQAEYRRSRMEPPVSRPKPRLLLNVVPMKAARAVRR